MASAAPHQGEASAAARTRTAEFTLPAAEVPDRRFRVAVGAPSGRRGTSVVVEQPRSLLGLVRELRDADEVASSAMAVRHPEINKAAGELRRGDATGRLLALQEVRPALLKTEDSGVRFTAPVTADGVYTVRLRYANAMGATQTMTLDGGTQSVQVRLPTLPTWDPWSEHRAGMRLAEGAPLDFVFGPDDNGNVNLDHIVLEPDPGVVRR